MRLRPPLALLPLAFVAGCGSSEAPGGVTAAENKALDEAAEMVEAQQLSPSAIPPAPRSQVPAAPAGQ
jgi:hypothetical protein